VIGIIHGKRIICPACGATLTTANPILDYGCVEDFQAFFFKRRCKCKAAIVTFTNIGMTERYGIRKPADYEQRSVTELEDKTVDAEEGAPEPVPAEDEDVVADIAAIIPEEEAMGADVVPEEPVVQKRKRRTKEEMAQYKAELKKLKEDKVNE